MLHTARISVNSLRFFCSLSLRVKYFQFCFIQSKWSIIIRSIRHYYQVHQGSSFSLLYSEFKSVFYFYYTLSMVVNSECHHSSKYKVFVGLLMLHLFPLFRSYLCSTFSSVFMSAYFCSLGKYLQDFLSTQYKVTRGPVFVPAGE